MKQVKFFLTSLLCLVISNTAMAVEKPIPVDQLPDAAKAFVQTHFPQRKIMLAEKDWNSYECRLDDGTKIEFNRKGSWKEVDCHLNEIPAGIVPATIMEYVKANFPGCIVTKVDKERYGYDIGLSNDLDLKFNYQGVLIGMDD